MRCFVVLLLTFAAVVMPCRAQAPASPAKPPPKLTTKDIRAYRFARELDTQKFEMNDREMPDELRVTTVDKIHINGKKRQQGAPQVKGRPAGHVGKLALIAAGDRTGKVAVKVPFAEGVTFYY